jgi:hypothetical protein
LFEAQSNIYRRLSSNVSQDKPIQNGDVGQRLIIQWLIWLQIYKTKEPNVYYHTHGSLESTPTLQLLGLPGYNPKLTRYDEIVNHIQDHCSRFTAEELDAGTERNRQAGGPVLKRDDFLKTAQGQALTKEPLISMTELESSSPPAPWPPLRPSSDSEKPQILAGIKILDLSRVIAGPVISRTLAEYGANVLKVTSASLPDVPYFQLDLNFGKRTTDLNLKDPEDRKKFEALLDDGVDVIIDGYRTGALERLGYGYQSLIKRFANRGKGFVYVAENCFGFSGPWKERSGWQPIADAVSGVAWGHGQALGLDEPVLPPFAIADFATGELGAIAALTALWHRAVKGGSYLATVSLTKYNLWVESLGQLPPEVWDLVFEAHAAVPQTIPRVPGEPEISMRALNHLSNFDIVSKAAMQSMKHLHPGLFDDRYMFETESAGFGRDGKPGLVKSCKPVVSLSATRNEFVQTTRPNGYDKPTWNET